jgi:hypothetical protein
MRWRQANRDLMPTHRHIAEAEVNPRTAMLPVGLPGSAKEFDDRR